MIPAKISNGSKTLKINALLSSGYDASLITSKLAHELQRVIEICHYHVKISYLFDFMKAPSWAFTSMQCMSCWYIKLTTPKSTKARKMQSRLPHLSKIQLDIVNKDISILNGADMPQPHINCNVVLEWPNKPNATLKKLGWVVLIGKTKNVKS